MTAQITFAGFQPAGWLQLLVEHQIRNLYRDEAGITSCAVRVDRIRGGWDVELRVCARSGGVVGEATTAGARPKDVLIPLREAFSRARRQLRRRGGGMPAPGLLPPFRFAVIVEPERAVPLTPRVRNRSAPAINAPDRTSRSDCGAEIG